MQKRLVELLADHARFAEAVIAHPQHPPGTQRRADPEHQRAVCSLIGGCGQGLRLGAVRAKRVVSGEKPWFAPYPYWWHINGPVFLELADSYPKCAALCIFLLEPI